LAWHKALAIALVSIVVGAFVPMTEGQADPARGITQFVVGTGERSLTSLGHPLTPANLETAQDIALGVLGMTLDDGHYTFDCSPRPVSPRSRIRARGRAADDGGRPIPRSYHNRLGPARLSGGRQGR
jgi:hypothetical protein